MARDKNDARVTFTELGQAYGLTLPQIKQLWRVSISPYEKEEPIVPND